jgi:hypothetical protein
MKLGLYIMAHGPISTAYIINTSHHFMHVYMCTLPLLLGSGSVNNFLRKRIYATIEEFLDASFPIRSLSYQMIVCGSVYVPPILVYVPPKRWSEGSQSCLTEKYGHESLGTRNKEPLCWRGPSVIYWTVLDWFYFLDYFVFKI